MMTPRVRDRGQRPQAGAWLAVTDGRETVGYVVEAGDHFEARTVAGELAGTYPTLAGASVRNGKFGHSLELRIAKQCRGKKDNPATR
jgi:hypothetical protein